VLVVFGDERSELSEPSCMAHCLLFNSNALIPVRELCNVPKLLGAMNCN
jgi:hypothetical protein